MIRSIHFRTAFILLLLAGPLAILPFLILMPTFTVARAAWRSHPRLPWRFAVSLSFFAAILMSCPSSPMYWGIDRPIPVSAIGVWHAFPASRDLVVTQCCYLNASLITAFAMLPVNTIYTIIVNRKTIA